jgi:hypothetical protein
MLMIPGAVTITPTLPLRWTSRRATLRLSRTPIQASSKEALHGRDDAEDTRSSSRAFLCQAGRQSWDLWPQAFTVDHSHILVGITGSAWIKRLKTELYSTAHVRAQNEPVHITSQPQSAGYFSTATGDEAGSSGFLSQCPGALMDHVTVFMMGDLLPP